MTPSEVRVGSSLALTGHARALGKQTLAGARAYLDWVNDNGGVHGRRIELIAYDDAYDPARCLVNTQKLLVEDRVFALFCYVGTPTTVKVLPLIERARIPLLGVFTGAAALRDPHNPLVLNVRASYYQEIEAAVDRMVDDLGLTRIAVFYQYDAFGFDGLAAAEKALDKRGLSPVARGDYTRGTTEVSEGLNRIVDSGAEAVIMIGTAAPCAAFVRRSRDRGFNPAFHTVSFVDPGEFATHLKGQDDALVLLTQVVPDPGETVAPGGPEYAELLARYDPRAQPTAIGLEGFYNARVLVEGLRRAGRGLTRQGFIDAVESLRGFPLSRSLEVSFGPGDHQGLDEVFMTRFQGGSFRPVEDWGRVRALLASGEEGS
ncbi:ABC transporter substrate-binding protein [Desulfohalovibrio reitneri]|uniref:ABC transporter substrate-binding protein n=1 Tax=Desulfohalovibrio reitneri TaxID=1307759 RepID=UPI000B1F4BBC|nr:ABC transporter substrate-binding protein [Desulfohalovibrio reitneri]